MKFKHRVPVTQEFAQKLINEASSIRYLAVDEAQFLVSVNCGCRGMTLPTDITGELGTICLVCGWRGPTCCRTRRASRNIYKSLKGIFLCYDFLWTSRNHVQYRLFLHVCAGLVTEYVGRLRVTSHLVVTL